MRRWLLFSLIILAIGSGFLIVMSRSRVVDLPGVSSGSSQDAKTIEQMTLQFLEDVRFKDFARAASYHSVSDRKKVDIARLIEEKFAIKPELLDVLRYEVIDVELDSTGNRGKVKTRTVARILNTEEVKDLELMFYWEKNPRDGWVMRLESSL